MKGDFEKLSKRERQIAFALINEKSTTEIAALLGLKRNTVSTFKKIIYHKMGVRSEIGLFKLALNEGMINF